MTFHQLIVRIQIGIAVAFVGLVLGFYFFKWRKPAVPLPPTVLPAEIKERISIDTRRKEVMVVTRKGVTKKVGVRHAQIDIGQNGTVVIRDRQFGFSLEPGFTFSFDGTNARAGLDSSVFYYRRLGILVGFSLPIKDHMQIKDLSLPLGIAYQPLRIIPNLSLYAGSSVLSFGRRWELGIRVAL